MRMSMAQSGPVNDIIDSCARHIDEQVCETLVPRITDILRSGVDSASVCKCNIGRAGLKYELSVCYGRN